MSGGLKFAVVREDPALEARVVAARDVRRALLIASGGCTALSLQARFPRLEVTVVDPNPAQLAVVRQKAALVARHDEVGLQRLCQSGEFEALFACLRNFVWTFVAPESTWTTFFAGAATQGADAGGTSLARDVFTSRYWPVAFQLHFADELLVAMFGPDAVQHAEAGSYPAYFRAAFERGLLRADAPSNYFLQHVLLGRYVTPPAYWRSTLAAPFDEILGRVDEVPQLDRFDLIGLSNICDWMPADAVRNLGRELGARTEPGTTILLRQLNNDRNLAEDFPDFAFDAELGKELLAEDRSLFYSRIWIGRRSGGGAGSRR